MGKIFKKKATVLITGIILIDIIIGYFLFTNRSFPRLAIWNIIESDNVRDFYWEPRDKPPYFYFEPDSDKLSIFRNEVLPLVKGESDELKIAVIIARYAGNIRAPGSALGALRLQWDSPEGILNQIRAGGIGNCFHYSILYSTYLSSIGIKSRLWTLEGDDGLDKLTHTVCEVYSQAVKKWILVDAFWGVYFTKDNHPLSVLELRDELLTGEPGKISVQNILGQTDHYKEVPEEYRRLLKQVFLRTANDFVNKYDSRIRYGALSKFQRYLDRFPSVWRRGLSYLLDRRDFLIHYIDSFNASLKQAIIISRLLFYFFIASLVFIFILPLAILMFNILRKSLLARSLSISETRRR